MCGIAGDLRFDETFADGETLNRMADKLAPRGPDGYGVHIHKHCGLAHRRLKIIDLTETGHQPMVDSELGLDLVFNGCIYNHKDLRQTLEGMGYRFFSTSDTEVILKGFHAWGADVVHKLNGMFAFAILERDRGRVTLARDRLGIKPLYIAQTPNRLRFASNLTALLAGGEIDTQIDPVALHHYFSFHAVVPAPRTLLQGVRKLPPASWMRIERDGTTQTHQYWQPSYNTPEADQTLTRADWCERLEAALRASVKRRLVADVPVGVLLSGGLDSSLIVGLLAEAGAKDLNTFSIGFETVGEEKGDEFQYSDIIAERYQTHHHKIEVDSTRALPALPKVIEAMAEPMVSHDCVGFFLLSEEVSKKVKVVQSGQGADEAFGGYHWYPPMRGTNDPFATYQKAFFDRDHDEMAALLMPDWISDDYSSAFVRQHFAHAGADDPIDKALRLDSHIMLVDDPVKRVDNMTMAWGLEARVPFLDHEVIELAAQCPADHHLDEDGKGILKTIARKIIPHEVIDRPKGYFPVPALKYLRGPYLDMVRDSVTSQAFRQRGLVNPAYIDKLLDDPEAHITPLRGSKLWQIGVLSMWMETHL